MSIYEIEHEDDGRRGAFYIADGDERPARMTYVRQDDGTVTIDHTVVDERFRGQGVGRKLLDAAVAWARRSGTRVSATCPFAVAQFRKDESIRDVLAAPLD